MSFDIIWCINNSNLYYFCPQRWYFYNNFRIVCRKQLPDKFDWLQQHTTGSCAFLPLSSISPIWYQYAAIRLYKFELQTSSQPGNLCETCTLNMLHFIRDIFKHISIRMSKASFAFDILIDLMYLLQHISIMPQRKGRRKKIKTDHCPDVGQKRHVFAFMFWNLHCKVATVVQGISHITLQTSYFSSALLPFVSLCLCLFDQNFPSYATMYWSFLNLSFFLHLSYLYQNVPTFFYFCMLCVFLHRTTPVTQPLARASMLSITTVHHTHHPT